MAYSPSWTMLAAVAALFVCALIVCVRRVRAGTSLRSVGLHALLMGLATPLVTLGIVVTCAFHDGAFVHTPGRLGLVTLAGLAATICAAVTLWDLGVVLHASRVAKLARKAKAPTVPLTTETRGFDFGVGDEVAVIEKAPDDPYREIARAKRFFYGSPSRSLGAMRRAWALEWLAVMSVAGATAIAAHALPGPETLVNERSPVVPPPEPKLTWVWSTPSAGDARLRGGDQGHAVVELSLSHPAKWSLHTIDLGRGYESATWIASPEQAKAWTGLHTADGVHAVDHDFEHDLATYASTVRHDSRVAVSSDEIVYAKREEEDTPTQLFMANRDGTGRRRLDRTHVASDSPEFSRDATRLAWIAWDERVASVGYSLVSARADGSQQHVVPGDVSAFGWRADGHLIGHTKEHERECIFDADGGATTGSMRHCVQDGRLGSLIWDDRGNSVAWVGFVSSTLTYEWIRLATGEVLAHGAVTGAEAFSDALLDAEEPALFVTSGRGSAMTFAMQRIDLRSGAVTDVVPSWQPAASGRGVMAWGGDGSILYLERGESKVSLLRVWPSRRRDRSTTRP